MRALSLEEAQEQRPVVIEGTVIYFPNIPNDDEGMVVMDGTARCWVASKTGRPFVEQAEVIWDRSEWHGFKGHCLG